ncbi:MAG: carotenoid 1,2-hydratase, partial [Chloroflexi bacterium]|nr:carotenoid 1,2-hydratase [Chloroflexota bacterium]
MNRATRVITSLGLATGLLAACASPTPTPTPTATPVPTPTPTATATPFPVPTPVPLSDHPPLTLPADESPHAYLVEWWYFNAHFTSEEQERYALHDVVFRIREPTSGVAGHVRHI